RAAAATARALLLAIAKRCLVQQLVPFRLIVERNAEQAAPPLGTGRGVSLWQDINRALMPAAAVTTVLERVEQGSLERNEKGGDLRCPPCLQNVHAQKVLVRRAHLRIVQAAP